MAARKVSGLLSDGREIFYFDDKNSSLAPTRAADARHAADRPGVAQMRLDSLTGDWISVAAHRHGRAFLPPASECPLCPSTESFQSEIPDQFDVAVFENKSPSFGPTLAEQDDAAYSVEPKLKLGAVRDSIGRCEVVVFSPQHDGSVASLELGRVETIIDALTDRTDHLLSLPGIRTVFPFENRGQDIGVTLHHPHGQIYGYPYVTPTHEKYLASIEKFGTDLFAQTLAFERAGERVVLASDNFTVFVPFAGRWPIELMILPHRQVNSFIDLTQDERTELASVYSRTLKAVDALYESPTPYIAAWHQAPRVDGGENIRFHFRLTSPRRAADKLKYLAGSESAMGAFIADFPQETTAARLREVLS
jgi:UDPglucose--hexose-1-phosphate uridylyltransferase